jgi:hypothetical protein
VALSSRRSVFALRSFLVLRYPGRPHLGLRCELTLSQVGIVGLGNIGQMLADMCAALGMSIIYTSRHRKDVPYEHVTLDKLYARADCVVLTCPLTKETKGMINREAISKMKDGVVLVNVGGYSSTVIVGGPGCIDDVLIGPQREVRWSRRMTWWRRLKAEKVRACRPSGLGQISR